MLHEALTHSVIGAFFYVYNRLPRGHLEHVYVRALAKVLRDRGHKVELEVATRVRFEGELVGFYRLDLLVDDVLVVEVKSCEPLPPNATRQLLNCLKSTDLELGLLLHFGKRPAFFRLIATNDYSPLPKGKIPERAGNADGSPGERHDASPLPPSQQQ